MTVRRRPWQALGALALGCSTLAPLPTPQECENDDDCSVDGELCAHDTRVCVPGSNFPPIADLGFDIQETVGGQVVFRAEVGGCDVEMGVTQSGLALTGRELEQSFDLAVFVREPADPASPVVEDLLAGTIELSQASRFSRAPLAPPRVNYPALDSSGEVVTVLPTTLRWPRYHPFDVMPPILSNGGFVLWRSIPTDGAPILQMLVPPQLVTPPPDPEVDPPIESCTLDTQCCRVDESGEACESSDPNTCVTEAGLCTAIGNPRFRFTFRYDDRCARSLGGRLVVVDGTTLERHGGVAGVPLTIRHADTSGMSRLGMHAIDPLAPDERAAQCSSNAQCISGEQFCDPDTDQCVLALAGRPADGGGTVTIEDVDDDGIDDNGTFVANVYTYCESNPNNVGYVRSFTVSAAPSGPLAALSYTFDASVAPLGGAGEKPVANVPKDLCVPDWGVSVPLSLQLTGDAVPLLGSGEQGYVCCDVGCLPGSSADAQGAEPTQLETCDGRTSAGALPIATVSATLALDADQLAIWDEAGCQPPDADQNGIVGGIRRKMDCSGVLSDATCIAPDLAAGPDGSPREYELRIESPVGSLFASKVAPISVEPTGATQDLTLDRRVLVRGRVVLDAGTCAAAAPIDGDCGSEGALVRAERLRMDETGENAVGPYFHEVSTFYDPIAGRQGGYVLPLDPGVYLLTALPLSGSRGGPAAIAVIDLRDGEDTQRDLVLVPGVLVTLDLTGFDPRAQILPLDRGSWRDLIHPGRADDPDPALRTVNLNAAAECLQSPDEVPQACRIRRLTSGSSLSPSQTGQVRFTTRSDPGAEICPN